MYAKIQPLSQEIALILFKEQWHFFSAFKVSSWTARWDRQGLQISDCRKAEQPWIESVSICWQLSKFALYVIQQSRDWSLGVNCGYVSMYLGNKSVNCSTCTMLVVKKGFWNFIFFFFPLFFCTVDWPLHLNLLIPLIKQEFFLMVLFMLLKNKIKNVLKQLQTCL